MSFPLAPAEATIIVVHCQESLTVKLFPTVKHTLEWDNGAKLEEGREDLD